MNVKNPFLDNRIATCEYDYDACCTFENCIMYNKCYGKKQVLDSGMNVKETDKKFTEVDTIN